jgi:hypothetical protein
MPSIILHVPDPPRREPPVPRTETLDGGDVFVITIDPESDWSYSRFPHPLITLDYDRDGNLIQIVAVGPEAKRLSASLTDTVLDELRDSDDREATHDVERALAVA